MADERDTIGSRTWPRRILLGLGAAGLVTAVLLTATGSTRHGQREAQRRQELARAQRQSVAAARSRVRPLDPRVAATSLAGELPRRVLGLYNSKDPLERAEEGVTHEEVNHLHLRAELILNHLGLLVDLRDASGPLPGDEEMQRYQGVVAWFASSRLADPVALLRWLAHQADSGRRVLVLELGWPEDGRGRRVSAEELSSFYASLGLTYGGLETDDPEQIALVVKDPAAVEHEHRLPALLPFYQKLTLAGPGESWLTLRRTDREESEATAVAVTGRGGLVAPGYAIHEGRLGRNLVKQWRIDPFRFFARALDVAATPRPDFTTLNGSRIFYSHVDGDGLRSISEIDRRSLCGEYARDHLLRRYDLPVTTSFVVADLAPPPAGLGSARALQVARSIAALPNVESASHGFAHPMNWRDYGKAQLSFELPGYRMHAEKEIAYATRFIDEQVNPPGKPVMVMLWTGWCNPAEDQLAVASREGLYNLNGGDPVMDDELPSYLHLAPLIHRVGREVQYYSSGPNDFVLTEEWQPPYHRWGNLLQMLRATERPRRILPINVYFHWYVAEKQAAMLSTTQIFEAVLAAQPAPLFASEYIDVVRDFATLRLARLDAAGDRWRVLNSGYCRTLRFDGPPREVALDRSRGVIGFRYLPEQRALYVHLDEGHDHVVELSAERPRRPYLVQASHYLSGVRLTTDGGRLRMRGIGRKLLTLANLAPGVRYRVVAVDEQGRRLAQTVVSSATGTLEWHGDLNGEIAVSLERERP